MDGRNWLDMGPEEFDVDHEPTLFDIAAPLAGDGCGTGDLLDEVVET